MTGNFIVNITGTEDLTGFTVSDFVVTNGTAVSVVGSGNHWTLLVAPTAPGQITIELPENTVTDLNNMGNHSSNALKAFMEDISISEYDGIYPPGTPPDLYDSDPLFDGFTAIYNLESGQIDTTIDAGIIELSTLGDFVWEDLNARMKKGY